MGQQCARQGRVPIEEIGWEVVKLEESSRPGEPSSEGCRMVVPLTGYGERQVPFVEDRARP
jgi:hypothetical protein